MPAGPDIPKASSPGAAPSAAAEAPIPPLRVLGLSVLALLAAASINLLWPESGRQYAGLVWVLGLVPVSLFAYYRGWKGAAAATLGVMAAFALVEAGTNLFLGRELNWWYYGIVSVVAAATTLGTGTVAELLHRRRREAVQLALHDSVTGLPNRRLLRIHADQFMAAARRNGSRVGLVFLDLVRFKRVNDTLGHKAGDEVLYEVGRRIREDVRAADQVGRLGGDEFVVLLGSVEGPEDALIAARRVRNALDRPFEVEGREFRLAGRLGVALFPDHASDFRELLSCADRAVYRSGRLEDLHIALFKSRREDEDHRGELILEADLRRALEAGDLELHYQPILRPADGELMAAEALVRWRHPDRGLLRAGAFIGMAHRSGLIERLDRWVIQSVLADAPLWYEEAGLEWVAVNLLPSSLADPELTGRLELLLAGEGIPAEALMLEISERAALRYRDATVEGVGELRELGVRVAIDDFGTGHTSLAVLRQLPLDALKLDMVFTEGLGEDPEAEKLVAGVVALGHSMGRLVGIEGVETETQLRWLRQSGCDYLQGYRVGRPGPIQELGDFSDTAAAATSPGA